MKTIKFLTLVALFIGFTSCNKEDIDQGIDVISFEGSFSRDFEVQGTAQRATYTITQSTIRYDLIGGHQTNYTTTKNYFSTNNNRWIGYRESNSTFYVIFFKDISDTEITLYKKEVASLDEGESTNVPAADDTENHGWNTYYKNLPISKRVENLHAPQAGGQGQPVSGEFTKFDFENGAITTSDTEWDIAFRGTSIIVNGGVSLGTVNEPNRTKTAAIYIESGTMDSVTEANINKFEQDTATGYAITTGSGNGWYTYAGPPTHLINPTAGKIIVIKTRTGKYAKIEILSYYKDAPASPNAFTDPSKYYTFNYVYQPNENVTTF